MVCAVARVPCGNGRVFRKLGGKIASVKISQAARKLRQQQLHKPLQKV